MYMDEVDNIYEKFDGLSFRQFQFCEEYLRHFNADEAAKTVYKGNHRNGSNVLKSAKVRAYLLKRLEEKKNTIETLTDKSFAVMAELLNGDDNHFKNEAVKNVIKLRELDSKIKELEERMNNPEKDVKIEIHYDGYETNE